MALFQPEDDAEHFLDDDIVDIFAEEAGEVMEEFEQYFPRWRSDPEDVTAVSELRRAFHTLKGSGRMVKALVIADLAWAIENMLNKVVDGTVPATGAVYQAVEAAGRMVPGLVEAFQRRNLTNRPEELNLIIQQAEAITQGKVVEQAIEPARAATTAATTASPASRRTPKTMEVEEQPPILVQPNELGLGASELYAGPDMMDPRVDGLDQRLVQHEQLVTALGEGQNKISKRLDDFQHRLTHLDSDLAQYTTQADLEVFREQIQQVAKESQELKYFLRANNQKLMEELNEQQSKAMSQIRQQLQDVEQIKSQLSQDVGALHQSIRKAKTSAVVIASLVALLVGGGGAAALFSLFHL